MMTWKHLLLGSLLFISRFAFGGGTQWITSDIVQWTIKLPSSTTEECMALDQSHDEQLNQQAAQILNRDFFVGQILQDNKDKTEDKDQN